MLRKCFLIFLCIFCLSGCDGIVLEDAELLDGTNEAAAAYDLTFEATQDFPDMPDGAVLTFCVYSNADKDSKIITEVFLESNELLLERVQNEYRGTVYYFICDQERSMVLFYIPYAFEGESPPYTLTPYDDAPAASIGDRIDPDLLTENTWKIYCINLTTSNANSADAHTRVIGIMQGDLVRLLEDQYR